ncbi:hypothetical protein BDK51DRAFT_49100 [Blyttiomyces helicus]|uniref:Uncharacterized protein n=1 Tax=Blyttiomyces helicus TaxID=388810 RepID=A0A4P9VXF9_9FUNG|nr:hypothetical protein BDK51DRAFT_49100 [Blyttiomyces helicus]|eukprot:RKO84404.1 hypothetical protein BDK51DRAFT_49100 [Blyttiomyces helicus]
MSSTLVSEPLPSLLHLLPASPSFIKYLGTPAAINCTEPSTADGNKTPMREGAKLFPVFLLPSCTGKVHHSKAPSHERLAAQSVIRPPRISPEPPIFRLVFELLRLHAALLLPALWLISLSDPRRCVKMFKNDFQGGPAFELFSSSGSALPVLHWKVDKKLVQRTYCKDVRGFCYCVEKSGKLSLPKDDKQSGKEAPEVRFGPAYLVQPFLVLQVYVPQAFSDLDES